MNESTGNTVCEPIWDVAHLAHVEMLTPKLDESTRFFTDIMGMSITATQGDSVYLRAYDDYEHHTLKLTASPQPGMRHYAWRARSPQALTRRVAAIDATGYGIGWNGGDLGHGPAYEFRSPDGHRTEIYFETEKVPLRASTTNRPSKIQQVGFREGESTFGASTTSTCLPPMCGPSAISSLTNLGEYPDRNYRR